MFLNLRHYCNLCYLNIECNVGLENRITCLLSGIYGLLSAFQLLNITYQPQPPPPTPSPLYQTWYLKTMHVSCAYLIYGVTQLYSFLHLFVPALCSSNCTFFTFIICKCFLCVDGGGGGGQIKKVYTKHLSLFRYHGIVKFDHAIGNFEFNRHVRRLVKMNSIQHLII